jgi:hypothetical protein
LDFAFFLTGGAQCNCDFRAIGNNSSGSYVINSCIYKIGSSAGGDPGCNALNDTGTYGITNNILTTNDSSGIGIWK